MVTFPTQATVSDDGQQRTGARVLTVGGYADGCVARILPILHEHAGDVHHEHADDHALSLRAYASTQRDHRPAMSGQRAALPARR